MLGSKILFDAAFLAVVACVYLVGLYKSKLDMRNQQYDELMQQTLLAQQAAGQAQNQVMYLRQTIDDFNKKQLVVEATEEQLVYLSRLVVQGLSNQHKSALN